jgi:hypothetical protein
LEPSDHRLADVRERDDAGPSQLGDQLLEGLNARDVEIDVRAGLEDDGLRKRVARAPTRYLMRSRTRAALA